MEDKGKWLQVRMSAEEKDMLDRLASDYRLDMSTFIREAVRYLDAKRPALEIVPEGKDLALTELDAQFA